MSPRHLWPLSLLLMGCLSRPASPSGASATPARSSSERGAAGAAGAGKNEPARQTAVPPEVSQALEAALTQAPATPWPLRDLLAEHADANFAAALRARSEEALDADLWRQVEAWVSAERLRRDAAAAIEPVRLPAPHQVTRRENDKYRDARLKERREWAPNELKPALERLEELRKQSDEQVAGQRERALEVEEPLPAPDGPARLVDVTEAGFVVERDGERREYGWGTCPPALGVEVRARGVDPEDPMEQFRLGLYALERGRFDRAEEAFAVAGKKNPMFKQLAPSVDDLRRRAELFRGDMSRDGDRTEVRWTFDPERSVELSDFTATHAGVRVGTIARQLRVEALGSKPGLAEVRGAWDREVTVEAVVTSVEPPPSIGVRSGAGTYLVAFGERTELRPLSGEGDPLASSEVRARPGKRVRVEVERAGVTARLTVAVEGERCFSHEVPAAGPLRVLIGGSGRGAARFAEVSLRGHLDAHWAARTLALARGRLPREVKGFELSLAARSAAGPRGPGMPAPFAPTSAEDEIGLKGLPDEAKELLTAGRRAVGGGDGAGAAKAFEEAAAKWGDVPAVAYLRGRIALGTDPQDAVVWLDRAARGIVDFHEAIVARGAARVRLGRYDAARADLAAAEPLRVDYAPLYVSQSDLAVAEGRLEAAEDLIERAFVLTPGSLPILHRSARIEALREGPGFGAGHRFHSARYTLDTAHADQWQVILRRLETLRDLFEELLPVLIGPEADARDRVVVFADREAYHAYQGRTCEATSEADALFDGWSNQLVAALPARGDGWDAEALHTLQHEALHQWVRGQGVALPAWASEGLAEYVGGTELDPEGRAVTREGALSPPLRESLHVLVTHWEDRVPLETLLREGPDEFRSGAASVKYPQAWSLAHYLILGEDAAARRAFYRYLHLFAQVKGRPEQAPPGRDLLTFAYDETFGELPTDSLTRGWEAWVARQASEAGLPAPGSAE